MLEPLEKLDSLEPLVMLEPLEKLDSLEPLVTLEPLEKLDSLVTLDPLLTPLPRVIPLSMLLRPSGR